MYYTNDANFNVTALVETDGDVIERYTYDPYGKRTIHAADWSEITWANSKKNEILFTGHRLDPESGLYYCGARYYHPTLGRWLLRDGGYWDGVHLYQYCRSMPNRMVDPSGTLCGDCCPPRDPKYNKYHVKASEPAFTPGDRTPKDLDFSSLDIGLSAIEITDTVGGLATGGAQKVAEGGRAITGVLDSAAHIVADPGTFTGMEDAVRQGVDNLTNIGSTGGVLGGGGVSMFVKVKYKSCDPCGGLIGSILYLITGAHEMTNHETQPYRCTNGNYKPLTSLWRGKAVYRDKATALQYKSACQKDAEAAFGAGTLK